MEAFCVRRAGGMDAEVMYRSPMVSKCISWAENNKKEGESFVVTEVFGLWKKQESIVWYTDSAERDALADRYRGTNQ
jgi:hypothetical protein